MHWHASIVSNNVQLINSAACLHPYHPSSHFLTASGLALTLSLLPSCCARARSSARVDASDWRWRERKQRWWSQLTCCSDGLAHLLLLFAVFHSPLPLEPTAVHLVMWIQSHAPPSSPRLKAIEASVARLRSLALIDTFARGDAAEQQLTEKAMRSASAASAVPGLHLQLKEELGLEPPASFTHHSIDAGESVLGDGEMDEGDWQVGSPLSPLAADLAMPASPTLHTRRLVHVPFRPTPALTFPSASRAELSRLQDWSPPSSCASSPSHASPAMTASASPFSFHSLSCCDVLGSDCRYVATWHVPFRGMLGMQCDG